MKKTFLMLLSILALQAFSQKKDKSSSFDIPDGESYVLQLKNGNAFFMEITKKEGIKVLLFDTLRKKMASAQLNSKLLGDKIGRHITENVSEIQGDIAVFIQVVEERTPILIRLLVDAKTGKLKTEEKVAELERVKMGGAYAMAFGDVDIPDFSVVKDPESDYYAVVCYNTFAEDTKDRIEILHCSPDHKVINRSKYTTPDDGFKYTRYLNTYVNKDNYVIMATYAFNTGATGGKKGRFYISQLSKGKTGLKQQELSFTDFYKNVSCGFEYNKAKQLLNMSLITNVSSKGNSTYYEYHFQNINPSTLKVDQPYSPDFTQVNEYYKEKMERKRDFNGLLRSTGVDKNGNMVLFFQQKTVVSGKYGDKIYYGDVAMLTLSPAGKTINSAVFPASVFDGGSATQICMLTCDNNSYVLFNNTVDNMNLPETKEPKTLRSSGPAVPVKYTYQTNAVKKEYLFKEPKEKKGNAYCDFSVSHYSRLSRKYASLCIDPEKEKAYLVWVSLD